MFFSRKAQLPKVTKNEFNAMSDHIKTHFLSIKDVQLHTMDRINRLHENHNQISKNLNDQTQVMIRWLEYFDKMHKNHSQEIERLNGIMLSLNSKIESNSKDNEEFIKNVVENYVAIPKRDREALKHELVEEMKIIMQSKQMMARHENAQKNQEMAVINVNNDYNDKNVTRLNVDNVIHADKNTMRNQVIFTRSESVILGKIFNNSNPMSYNELARSTGHSPNTIKVYINSLKKKGVQFEEIDAPNGTKLYAIPNKERVKKLYNF